MPSSQPQRAGDGVHAAAASSSNNRAASALETPGGKRVSLSLKNRTQWGWIDIEQALDVVGSARELLNMVRGPSLSSPRRRSSARNRKSRLSSSSGTATEAFEDDRHLLSLDTLLGGDDDEEEFIDEEADEEEQEIIFKRLDSARAG